ncbi:DUF302 domain-containing protein [Candidatus Micrarchaeota archaeon]|nr:DUF302 domain-containing protein [Candidatus Micrarchaeota archaeon]
MKIDDFVYVVETKKSLDDSIVSVLKEVDKKGWVLFQVYDIRERLAAKGFTQKPLKIVEICSGKYANRFLNKNRLISLCMPCKINIFEDQGKVKIAGMNPAMLSEFFPEITKQDVEDVQTEIKDIIDGAK